MKNLFFYILTLIFIFTGYSQEIGKDHNDAMEYVYEQLKNSNSDLSTSEKLKNEAKKHSNYYFENISPITKNSGNINKKEVDKIYNEGIHSLYQESKMSLSTQQTKYLDQIDEIAKGQNVKLNDVLGELDILQRNANNELNDEDYEVVGHALDIATNTYQYWHTNTDKWVRLINESQGNETQSMSIDWGSVGNADFRGGVRGFFRGLFGGNPIGGAATGAATASIAEIIIQIISQL